MLPAMVERVFLGWDRPLIGGAAAWLLDQRESLPRWLVVVPTSQAGRRLREAMAETAGALLAPTFRTPGSFLQSPAPEVAEAWMEHVAWVEILEAINDWPAYQELFPPPPDHAGAWAGGLARDLVKLRHDLQQNGLTLAAAARLLANSVEAERWEALSRLEYLLEHKLRSWGKQSRSLVLADGVRMPAGITGIILAGVTEMPPLVERAWLAWDGPVKVLIGAPEHLADKFSAIGRPLAWWADQVMPWPEGSRGSVSLVADSRQQAVEALRVIVTRQTASNDVALGSADTDTGDELARAFIRHGWPAFHPAAVPVASGLTRWFQQWSRWLADPKLAVMANLLALPEASAWVGTNRAESARLLALLRDDWMAFRPDDLRHRITTTAFRSDRQEEDARKILHLAEALETWRNDFLRGDFLETMTRFLEGLASTGPAATEEAGQILNWLTATAPLLRQVQRSPGFWIDLMLTAIAAPTPQPPAGRVIDVQGWLELFFEPGQHLVLCGMNEGMVPARNPADPWLGEAAAKHLGLPANGDRAARDAYLYQAMLEARREQGWVDVICAKTGAGGEALLPSRLLLAAERSELPSRVRFLFRGIEPPEAGMHWHADWQWHARKATLPTRLYVTSLSTYLACPFRYYLKHAVAMQRPEPDRVEWNARDFGTVAHEVMERWGRDPDARTLTQPAALEAWLTAEADRIVTERFGPRVPLAVRVQAAALRQRLTWLARIQAESRAAGWEVLDVETKFEWPVGSTTVVGKIDRIDRHREHGTLRVIDYKTGRVSGVESEHRRKITAATVVPAHLGNDSPAVFNGSENGKPVSYLWRNLQLPLYALAQRDRIPDGSVALPCYFTLGATDTDVAIHEWSNFSITDLAAAQACTDWLVSQITAGIFWPPATQTTHDDFAVLAAGRSLEEMFSPL